MSVDTQKLSEHNEIVASCAIALASTMVRQVLGKAVSKNLSGTPIKDAALNSLIATNIKNELKL